MEMNLRITQRLACIEMADDLGFSEAETLEMHRWAQAYGSAITYHRMLDLWSAMKA